MDKKIIKRWNGLMYDLCREHLTIGTKFSEHTENWNLRDMVSEAQYTLDVYNSEDSIYWEDAHDSAQPGREWYMEWYKEKKKLERFINRYKEEALTMECTESHCSKYD